MKYNNKFNGLTYSSSHFKKCTFNLDNNKCRKKGIIQDNGIDYYCDNHFNIDHDYNETEISLSYLEGLGF